MKCLNCAEKIDKNFCPNCGQKTSTHRFSLKYIFDYAVLSGIFSIHSGILYSLKSLFTRPGHSIREYIGGSRIRYINAFTLLLLSITVTLLIDEYSTLKFSDIVNSDNEGFTLEFESFAKENPRIIYFLNLPLMSIASYLFFRKCKFNFAEHMVLNTYNTVAQVLLSLPMLILSVFYENKTVMATIYQYYGLLSLLYSVWLYYQFFAIGKYKKSSLIFRSLAAMLIFVILQGIVFAGIVLFRKFA